MWELILVQRMDSGEPSISRGQMPTLPEGVRPCEGFQENHGAQELLSSPMKLERTSQEQSVGVWMLV